MLIEFHLYNCSLHTHRLIQEHLRTLYTNIFKCRKRLLSQECTCYCALRSILSVLLLRDHSRARQVEAGMFKKHVCVVSLSFDLRDGKAAKIHCEW